MPGPVSTGMSNHIGIQLPVQEIYIGLTNNPGQLSLAISPSVGAISTNRRAVMFCGWRVKASADIARVCWQVKLYEPLYNMCHTLAL